MEANTTSMLFAGCLVAIAAFQQKISLVHALVFEDDEETEKRKKRRLEYESLPVMYNLPSTRDGPPVVPIPYRDRFGNMTEDPNRDYVRKLTHMYSWEIVELAMKLKPLIEEPRQTSWRKKPKNRKGTKRGRPPKYDPLNRLLFCLEWLSAGTPAYRAELENAYSKTSSNEDLKHILRAINEGLADQIVWPDASRREVLKEGYQGVMKEVVGIIDGSEHTITKSSNNDIETRTFSGKKNSNTRMTLAVMDKHGLFIYVRTGIDGARNDREAFTACDLYLEKGRYFSAGELIAADGGFEGNGPLLISYIKPDTPEKVSFNLAFKEVRMGIETAFGRVQAWFPILGNNKKTWNYDAELLELSVGASTKLHNWMLRNRGLDYNAELNPSNFYRNDW